ncbi:MAG: molybdopterin-dependent oxidoreductase [Acidobacteriota bacterium]|nr:molybdopterin-dependent oxidoreductase [Acidobacteriota bacterium]
MSTLRSETAAATTVASACPLDCPDACSLDVRVEEGRVVSIGGSRANPLTDGYICAKVRRFPEHVHGPDRVLHPQIRQGTKGEGRFRRASWDEALSHVAIRMRDLVDKGQADAILPLSYGGSNGYLSQDTTDARLFSRLGASRLARTVCSAPTGRAATGLYGKMAGIALQDYAHANLILLWGVNPSASGIHILPHVQAARKRGARVVVIDPRRTRVAASCDLHLAVKPGTDLPVALALIRHLFETKAADLAFLAEHATGAEELRRRASAWPIESAAAEAGIDARDLATLAEWYAEASPAAIRCGWGLERNRNGGSAAAAILALPAVGGKFGVRAGGYTLSNSGVWDLDSWRGARTRPSPAREINMNLTGEALLDRSRPVKLLFVYNCNPLVTLPAQEKVRAGLRREDLFTVVFDPVMTDTARYADVVLPATTFLERAELSRGYGAYVLQETAPVIPPVGESRPNHEVFGELCRRTGVARPGDPETAEELTAAILAGSTRGGELRGALDAGSLATPAVGATPIQFVDAFPRTADRRIHLVPEDLDREAPGGLYAYRGDPGSAAFPLALVSPASDRTISSSLGELWPGIASLDIHPADAEARGVAHGAAVRIHNSGGEVRCLARVTDEVRPGVVQLPKGLWSRHTMTPSGASALAPDSLTDLGGGACFNDARVEVQPIPAAR